MIHFFRRIRQRLVNQERIGKYLLYAVGEIILVVIGILIALSINNWNTNRIAQIEENKLYQKIINDLNIAELNINSDLTDFRRYQNLHLQIFNEINGKANYDPNLKYYELRWYSNYNSIISDNHTKSIDLILNEKIRDALNDYIKEEKRTITAFQEWDRVKIESLRPYIVKQGILDSEKVFLEVNSNWENIWEMNGEIYSYEKLRDQYGTQELDQLLSNLWIQTGYAIHRLESQAQQIRDFRFILENELN